MTDSTGLLAGISLDLIRNRIVAAPYQEFWTRLRRRWREVADWEAATGKTVYIGSCAGGQITWLVREAALDYALTGAKDALTFVHKQIDRLADVFLYHPENWTRREHPYWSEMHVALAADLCRYGLDDQHRDDLYRMVREHFVTAPYIGWDARYRFLAGHNMTVTEQACAGICALVLGEEAGCADWREIVQRAIESCHLYSHYSLDRGGYGYEGTMYAAVPMDIIYLFAQLLHQRGIADLFHDIPVMKTYPMALRSLLFPDRIGLCPLADGGILNPKSFAWLLLTAAHYRQPEDLGLWYEYRGPGRAADPCSNNNPRFYWPETDPAAPTRADSWGFDLFPLLWWDADAPMTSVAESKQPTANYSTGAEVATCRTSWSHDAVYLNLSGQGRGHQALDHAHADGGHVSLFAHGEYLAIDTGYWNTLEDHHSVVLIDGQTQFNRDNDVRFRRHYAGHITEFQRHTLLEYARVDQSHPRNCVWADRHVLFVRLGGDDAYVVLLDNINPDNGVHDYTWQLQCHPDSAIRLTGPNAARVEKANARLDVTVLSPAPDDFPTCPHAFTLRHDIVYGNQVEGHTAGLKTAPGVTPGQAFLYTEAQAWEMKSDLVYSNWVRPRLIAEQHGPLCLLMSILSPRRAGAAPLTVTERRGRRVLRAEIDCGEFIDTVIAALDMGFLDFSDVKGYSELALIRRTRDGKVIDVWTVDDSTLEILTEVTA